MNKDIIELYKQSKRTNKLKGWWAKNSRTKSPTRFQKYSSMNLTWQTSELPSVEMFKNQVDNELVRCSWGKETKGDVGWPFFQSVFLYNALFLQAQTFAPVSLKQSYETSILRWFGNVYPVSVTFMRLDHSMEADFIAGALFWFEA